MFRRSFFYIMLAAIAVFMFSCRGHDGREYPFKGYWHAVVSGDSVSDGYQLLVRFDFYDSTVCVDGIADALGVMSIVEDRAIYRTITNDVIRDVNIVNDSVAHIKYVQESSGQLWSGTVRYNPADSSIVFTNGEMLLAGYDSLAEPSNLPYAVNPTKVRFNFVNDKPNYKEIPSYYLVNLQPDRVYYRNIIADETIAPPFGDMQLRCYYFDNDRDVHITDEAGVSPLSGNYNATVVDCWALPDAPGIMLLIWKGSPRYQALTMYRVDDDNILKEVDFVTGRRSTTSDTGSSVDPALVATFYRSGGEVRAYDPSTGETRVYDLSGRRIR